MSRHVFFRLFFATAIAVLFTGCAADTTSEEACLHRVTMDLDQGNYSAVFSSPCADNMQRGGAFFERAGFRVRDIVNTFSKTGSAANPAGANTINTYLNVLIPRVDEQTLADLDSAKTEYLSVAVADDAYRDAQFNAGLADAVKGLSLLKVILDINGDGTLVTTCDKNANDKPDAIDASSCALFISAGTPGLCSAGTGTVYDSLATTPSTTITFDAAHPGVYRGVIIQGDGTGTNISGCRDPNQYKHLLHATSSAIRPWAVVTTVPGPPTCQGSDGNLWPCPIIQDGQPLDLVVTMGGSLAEAVDSMNTGLAGGNDVLTSLVTLQTDACPATPCTDSDVANYLQTYE